MQSINKVILLGRVGSQPQSFGMSDGSKLVRFSLATSVSWKDKATGEKRERTEWHSIIVGNQGLANFVDSYVSQGDLVYVEGSIQTRKYTDKSGVDRTSTEISVAPYSGEIVLLSSKKQSSEPQSFEDVPTADLDDDIPF